MVIIHKRERHLTPGHFLSQTLRFLCTKKVLFFFSEEGGTQKLNKTCSIRVATANNRLSLSLTVTSSRLLVQHPSVFFTQHSSIQSSWTAGREFTKIYGLEPRRADFFFFTFSSQVKRADGIFIITKHLGRKKMQKKERDLRGRWPNKNVLSLPFFSFLGIFSFLPLKNCHFKRRVNKQVKSSRGISCHLLASNSTVVELANKT